MATAGIVLCGGRSTRMGRAKAWLPWRGRPLVAHMAGLLGEWLDEVVVVASPSLPLPALAARVVRDRAPDLGPLAGIREGLAAIAAERAFVCGTDAPQLGRACLEALLGVAGAVAVESEGHVQTLAAVYPRSALATAERLIGAGRRRPLELLEAAGYQRIAAGGLREAGSLRGFNTPEAYLAAVRADQPEARVRLALEGRARSVVGRRVLDLPVGSLGELLAQLPPALAWSASGRVAPELAVWTAAGERLVDPAVPLGPDEVIRIRDATTTGNAAAGVP